ncbi:MAG TPA: response regulator [Stellaceae bacterium]|jgi:CheY-like chemotaxis protein|nr:response regulator [Stellaceae bacterium]
MARILVIDEDPDYTALIANALTGWGHDVESAPTGRNAFLRLTEAKFDLILTNIAMRAMDGVEFINWSPNGSRPPILAMSDYSSDQAVYLLKIAMLLGADASLRKPFTQQELHDVVTSLLTGGEEIASLGPTNV